MRAIPFRVYKHYKTKKYYVVLDIVENGNKESSEKYVVYFPVDDVSVAYSRPLKEFEETIGSVPRFELVTDTDYSPLYRWQLIVSHFRHWHST